MNRSIDRVEPVIHGSGGKRLSRRTFVRLSAAALSVTALRPAHATSTGASALLQQGRQFNEGNGVMVDFSKAAQLFQSAADAGSLEAQAWLGSMYLRGRGVPQSNTKASELINASAAEGNPVGLRFAGVLHQEGKTVPQDYGKAKDFYERAGAKGDAVANGRLGMMFLFGRGVQANIAQARKYLSQGASGGDPWSMVELGMLYKRDRNKSDRVLAFTQWTNAAALGNRVGAYRSACAYHYGIGTKKDPVAAFKHLLKSSAKGYPPAQLALGSLYAKGKTVNQDVERGYAMYSLAALQGNRMAGISLRYLTKKMTVQQVTRATALADRIRAKNPQMTGA